MVTRVDAEFEVAIVNEVTGAVKTVAVPKPYFDLEDYRRRSAKQRQ